MKLCYLIGMYVLLFQGLIAHQDDHFRSLFPLPSYKRVIDTSMKLYSDVLILEEKAVRHDRCDDLVDLIVGRLVRLESYIKQLIEEYQSSRTVSGEELAYLARLLEYMQITTEQLAQEAFTGSFNACLDRLKGGLSQALIIQ